VTALLLSNAQRARIEREARAAFPRECCGLLEGVRGGGAIRVVALHAARNLSPDNDRFEIDPADHFAALRAARANGHEIVGCYHSHPNGKPEPSARDGEGAWEGGFVWLIAAIRDGAVSLAAFARRQGGWQKLETREIAEKAA
jgi:proteasome lid subunit RPN8/RPN11